MTWNEQDHPRVPAGNPDGGQFTDKQSVIRISGAAKAAALGEDAPSAQKFIDKLLDRPDTMIHPLDPGFIAWFGPDKRYEEESIIRAMMSFSDASRWWGEDQGPLLSFETLLVPEKVRGRGWGDRALTLVKEIAQEVGIPVILDADPFGYKAPMTEKQLESWYKRRGWEPWDKDYSGEILIWYPE
jgi:hypothetical protein